MKAIATHDRAEVSGLIVDSVTRHGVVHGVEPYYRVNAYSANVVERLANRHASPSVIQVEAAERFFEHEQTGRS